MKFRVTREHFGDKMYMTGDEREAEEAEVAHLVKAGVLHPADEEFMGLRQDGPTVAEYVAAGYMASKYPPNGYASRSAPDEIRQAIQGQANKSEHQKAEHAPKNKVEPRAPKNKSAD